MKERFGRLSIEVYISDRRYHNKDQHGPMGPGDAACCWGVDVTAVRPSVNELIDTESEENILRLMLTVKNVQ